MWVFPEQPSKKGKNSVLYLYVLRSFEFITSDIWVVGWIFHHSCNYFDCLYPHLKCAQELFLDFCFVLLDTGQRPPSNSFKILSFSKSRENFDKFFLMSTFPGLFTSWSGIAVLWQPHVRRQDTLVWLLGVGLSGKPVDTRKWKVGGTHCWLPPSNWVYFFPASVSFSDFCVFLIATPQPWIKTRGKWNTRSNSEKEHRWLKLWIADNFYRSFHI